MIIGLRLNSSSSKYFDRPGESHVFPDDLSLRQWGFSKGIFKTIPNRRFAVFGNSSNGRKCLSL